MGTFVIKSSTLSNQYEYKDANLFVMGNYLKDATTDTLQSISGSCYRITPDGGQGDYVGNFNGVVRDGEILYTLSEMSHKDSDKVWDAIEEIEANILGENE